MKSDNKGWLFWGFIILVVINVILLILLFAGSGNIGLSPTSAVIDIAGSKISAGANYLNINVNPNTQRMNTLNINSLNNSGAVGPTNVIINGGFQTLGSAKINSDLTLARVGGSGGVIMSSNDIGSLTITPRTGAAKLEADLTLTRAGYSGGVLFNSNPQGSLTITPQSGYSKFVGNLSVSNLAGVGNSYVCVNSVGQLYRSLTACQ